MRLLYDGSPPPEGRPLSRIYGEPDFPPPYPERPYAFVNMAMTLDGKVVSGASGFLLTGSPGDRLGMDELRAAADCVLIGAGTLRTENPVLRIRSQTLRKRRQERGKPENPFYAVVSGSGTIPAEARMFASAPAPIVFTTARIPEEVREQLTGKAEMVIAREEDLDLHQIVHVLRDKGVEYLLVEGGPSLTFSRLEADLIDELFVTLAPLLKGGRDVPTLLEGKGFPAGQARHLQLLSVREHEGELFLRYRVAQRP